MTDPRDVPEIIAMTVIGAVLDGSLLTLTLDDHSELWISAHGDPFGGAEIEVEYFPAKEDQ